MDLKYSVLMSVYKAEKPEYLAQSLDSMLGQSLPPDQLVLVCDGPLTPELDSVLSSALSDFPGVLELVRLPENVGLGKALNAGLSVCRNEFVFRMDSDDVARPYRCERQLAFMEKYGLDLCSGTVEEFQGELQVTCKRVLPEAHNELVPFARKRNPMNHPCAAFRKSKVEQAGGYQHMPRFEDYDLWVRMILDGAMLGNLQEPLLYMRTDNGMYRRRSGVSYCRDIVRFWTVQRKRRFCSFRRFWGNIIIRCMVALLPGALWASVYREKLRSIS